ncbi:MAG: sulfur carrier protein ThiS [Sedimentisphaerales bacterium]|nr:sulfur carrier protein ThiS [Sedimentisphaerales bacterium]
MVINVNGKDRDIPDGMTIKDLLGHLSVKGPLAVELNRKVCPKKLHGQTFLNESDILEIVTIVGGG